MDLLQDKLNKVKVSWNTHLMCRARSQSIVTRVPDELFYIPEIQGKRVGWHHHIVVLSFQLKVYTTSLYLCKPTGYQNYSCEVNDEDCAFCEPYYTKGKPDLSPEFTDLAQIVMEDNGWERPNNCEEALSLYLNLVEQFE